MSTKTDLFIAACKYGCSKTAKNILTSDSFDISDISESKYCELLNFSCKEGSYEIIDFLIKQNIYNKYDYYYYELFLIACKCGHTQTAEIILSNHPSISNFVITTEIFLEICSSKCISCIELAWKFSCQNKSIEYIDLTVVFYGCVNASNCDFEFVKKIYNLFSTSTNINVYGYSYIDGILHSGISNLYDGTDYCYFTTLASWFLSGKHDINNIKQSDIFSRFISYVLYSHCNNINTFEDIIFNMNPIAANNMNILDFLLLLVDFNFNANNQESSMYDDNLQIFSDFDKYLEQHAYTHKYINFIENYIKMSDKDKKIKCSIIIGNFTNVEINDLFEAIISTATLSTIKWYISIINDVSIETIKIMFYHSCIRGKLEISKWLYETSLCDVDFNVSIKLHNGEDFMVDENYLFSEVIKKLARDRDIYIDMAKWLLTIYDIKKSIIESLICVKDTYNDILFLINNFNISEHDDCHVILYKIMTYLYSHNKKNEINLLKLQYKTIMEQIISETISEFTICICKANNHDMLLKIFDGKFTEIPNNIVELMKTSCKYGSLECAKILYDRDSLIFSRFNSAAMFNNVCKKNHVITAKWLLSLKSPILANINMLDIFITACSYDAITVVEWLVTVYEQFSNDLPEYYKFQVCDDYDNIDNDDLYDDSVDESDDESDDDSADNSANGSYDGSYDGSDDGSDDGSVDDHSGIDVDIDECMDDERTDTDNESEDNHSKMDKNNTEDKCCDFFTECDCHYNSKYDIINEDDIEENSEYGSANEEDNVNESADDRSGINVDMDDNEEDSEDNASNSSKSVILCHKKVKKQKSKNYVIEHDETRDAIYHEYSRDTILNNLLINFASDDTGFYNACHGDNINLVQILLKIYPDYININEYALRTIYMQESINTLRLLLTNNTNISSSDAYISLMTVASLVGADYELTRLTLQLRPDIKITYGSNTLFYFACNNENEEVIKYLYELNPDEARECIYGYGNNIIKIVGLKSLSEYSENKEYNEIFKLCGVELIKQDQNTENDKTDQNYKPYDNSECLICFDNVNDIGKNNMVTTVCNHTYCKKCICEYYLICDNDCFCCKCRRELMIDDVFVLKYDAQVNIDE